MTAPRSLEHDFGQQHFGTVDLGDHRRDRRLIHSANLIARAPGGTLPDKFHRPADLEAFYRLMNHPQVTHELILEPHRARVFRELRPAGNVVLCLHDTTDLDYSGLKVVTTLGQIGNGGGRGYLAHHSLMVAADGKRVFGLASQILHRRPRRPARESVSRSRARKDRESRRWLQGVDAVGPSPAGQQWVHVCDRGADTFEFLEHCVRNQHAFVVRSSNARAMIVGHAADGERAKLHEHLASLPAVACYEIEVSRQASQEKERRRKQKRASRTGAKDAAGPAAASPPPIAAPARRRTRVAIRYGAVAILAPHVHHGEHNKEPLLLWGIHVAEIDPPAGVAPVEWFLLTDQEIGSAAQALEIVTWYGQRPIIEELHKAMKTGCGIETLQFTTEAALQPTIALLSVVAIGLLNLREAARRPDAKERRADELVTPLAVTVLSRWRHRQTIADWSVYDFTLALGRLGGHQNRKADGLPGWLTLWRGWQRLQCMLEAADCLAPDFSERSTRS